MVHKVDHHHVVLLAVAVAAANALFDALGVPWQVVVDDQRAELQVDALGPGLGGDHDAGRFFEMLDQRGAGVGGAGAGDAVGACVAFEPGLVDARGLLAAVGAVEEHGLACVGALLQQAQQIVLRAARFREDEGFALSAQALQLGKSFAQGREQGLALGVVADGGGHALELAQLGNFFGQAGFVRTGRVAIRLGPLFFDLVEGLVVLVQLLGQAGVFLACGLGAELVLQALGHGVQRTANGVAAGGQQLPQHQRNQLPLPCRQGIERGAAQVVGHAVVQGLFFCRWSEGLHHGDAPRVRDVGLHLAAQGAHAHALQAAAQLSQGVGVAQRAELLAKAGQVAKHALVHQADHAVQLQQGVLQGRGGEQHFGGVGKCLLQGLADHVAGLVHVAQTVGFVHHHQVPAHAAQVIGLGFSELVGADDDLAGLGSGWV